MLPPWGSILFLDRFHATSLLPFVLTFFYKAPMKTIFTIFALMLSSYLYAIEVDVISSEFGVLDQNQNQTLCMTVVRVPKTGELIGVIESIEDCYYARKAKKSKDHTLELDMNDLKVISMDELLNHLQSLDTQLKFLFSEGE